MNSKRNEILYAIKVGAVFAGAPVLVGYCFRAISWPRETWIAMAAWCSLSGLISGISLGRGVRPAVSFAMGFSLLGFALRVIMVAPQGFSGPDWEVSAWFSTSFAILFGLVGLFGSGFGGLGWKTTLIGAVGFAVSGALGGAIMGFPFLLRSSCDFGWVFTHAGWVIMYALGGGVLALVLGSPARQRSKRGLCVKCGYDLRGSGERCPECGTPFSNSMARFDSNEVQSASLDRSELR